MIGWRARLGIILPSVNVTTEPEYNKMLPDGITVHCARMGYEAIEPEQYERMIDDVPVAVRHLGHARVHTMAFACTSGSFYGGPGYDRRIIEMMGKHTSIPCTTTTTAVVEALGALGVRKVVVGTPYPVWVDEMEQKFLEASGLEVVNIKGLGKHDFDVCEIHPQTLYEFTMKEVNRAEADGVLLSCMGLRSLGILEVLENDLHKPVVTSNQATLWKLLKLANVDVRESMARFGRLFSV